MKTLIARWSAKCLLSLCLVLFLGQGILAQQISETFARLQGTWSGDYGKGIFAESWQTLSPQTLEGFGYYVVKGDTVMKEYLQIDQIGPHVGYLASVNNSAPVLFNLTIQSADSWTFQNSEHDFPQTIKYTLLGKGTLKVEVWGVMNGQSSTENYTLSKQIE